MLPPPPAGPQLAIELGSLGFFTLELGLKIVGYTLYKGPYAVLKSGWNWLDLVLVVATAGDLALTPTFGGSATRFFNIFKAARPLRLGARIVPFRRLLTALGNSLRAMGAVLLIFFMGWFGVAVTGMLLFQGKMRTCIDDGTFPAGGYRYGEQLDNGTWTVPPCSGTWLNPDTGLNETREYEWDNPSILHFDSFGYAMLSSWVVINTEGWADLLWRTTAIVDEDYAPDPDSEDGAWALVYFFLVILLFTLYLVNLVVGVLAETYARLMNAGGDDANSSVEGGALMAPDLKRFCEAQVEFRGSRPIQYPPPPGPLRRPFYRLSLSPRFEKGVTLLICAVAGVMLTNHEGQSDAVTEFQDSMEQFFCWAFVLEMIIMVIGQTPGVYFTAGRFLFDFFVTVMSVVDIGLFTYGGFCASSSDDNVVLSLFKGLRVLRLYRLCLRFEGTQRVLQMIFHAGQMIVLLVFLSVCLLFVMAQAGVAAFHGFDTSEYYEMRNQNFDDTRPALQLMFVVATGQKWLDYVDFLSAAGANPLWAAFFFFVALLAINFMLFNVIVVCLITSYEAEKNLCKYRAGLDSFRLAYAQFDVTGKEGIQGYRDLIRFLNMLEPPFTRPPYGTEEVRRGARELGVRRLLRRCCCCFRGPATRPKRTFITAHWQALLLEELEKFDGKYHEFLDSLFYLNDPDTDFGLKARFFAVQAAYYVAVIYRGFGRGMRRWKKHDQLPLLKQWKEDRKHHKRHKKGHLPGLQVKPGLLLKQFSFSSLKGSFRTRKKDGKVVGSGKDEHHGENTSIDSWDDGA